MRRLTVMVGAMALALGLMPGAAFGASAPQTFEYQLGAPDRGGAPNGDHVEITCNTHAGDPSRGPHVCGSFQPKPKALLPPPSGEFVHKDSHGNVLASGTWRATDLIDYNPYGGGQLEGQPLPPNWC